MVIVDNLYMGNKKEHKCGSEILQGRYQGQKISSIVKKEKIDVINHHAAQISVPDSVKHPAFDADINIKGTINLLEAARENKIRKFILSPAAARFTAQK